MATSIIKTDEIRKLNDTVLLSNGVLSNNVQFPAGHVLRTFYAEYNFGGSNIGVGSATVWDKIQLSITNPTTTDYLVLTGFMPGVGSDAKSRSLGIGFVYSTDNWTTNVKLGTEQAYEGGAGRRTNTHGSTYLPFTSYPVTTIIRVNHPTTSDYKIRFKLLPNDYAYIGKGENTSIAVLYAQEVQG